MYSTDFLSELENCREAGEGRGGGGNEGVRQRQSDGCREEEEEERGGEGERANHTPEQGEAVERYREKTNAPQLDIATLTPTLTLNQTTQISLMCFVKQDSY